MPFLLINDLLACESLDACFADNVCHRRQMPQVSVAPRCRLKMHQGCLCKDYMDSGHEGRLLPQQEEHTWALLIGPRVIRDADRA